MRPKSNCARAATGAALPIDVLAFPPNRTQLSQQRTNEEGAWRERARRARIVLFLGAGMFVTWAADVGAALQLAHSGGSTFFGVACVPLALIVVMAHLYGQWALERAGRGLAAARWRYGDVTQREAVPLIHLAREHAPVAQYLRCVGRQGRPLLRRERIALHEWVDRFGTSKAARPPPGTSGSLF